MVGLCVARTQLTNFRSLVARCSTLLRLLEITEGFLAHATKEILDCPRREALRVVHTDTPVATYGHTRHPI